MSRVIEQHRANKLAQAIVGYALQFYNGLDQMIVLKAGPAEPPGASDFLGAFDKSLAQQKWDLFNDWLQTNGTWKPPAGSPSFRISQDFINHFDTIPVWLENTVLTQEDPYGLFLNQNKDRRVQWTINGVKHRHRV